jgi:hypothetical protein
MRPFKLTTWNVEHAADTLAAFEGTARPRRRQAVAEMQAEAQAKMAAVAAEIAEVDPDILFVCEGPPGEERALRYFAEVAPGYRLLTRGDATGKAYATMGQQWLWFLVKEGFPASVSLLPIETWQAFTRDQTEGMTDGGEWQVSMPALDKATGQPLPHSLAGHRHYRHPQVAWFDWQGTRVEIIGVHLKSKFVNQRDPRKRWQRPASGGFADIVAAIEASPGFMVEAVRARAKLTTEVVDIRNYIDRRFRQEASPAIFVVGDVNDGPGKELIESWFMLHDLIGNLQGDVFFARRFLNHALFDIEDRLRWSVYFEDAVDPRRDPHILLDHILFTQRLSGGAAAPLRVLPGAGRVEHDIHERVASLLPRGTTTSDHRPVSVTVTPTGAATA